MKIAVIPDAAMIIVSLVTRYGHEYLSSTNFSKDNIRHDDISDEESFDESSPPFTMTGYDALKANKYTCNETPSGFRGRLSLYENILENAEAAIIIGNPPKNYNHMYDTLNEMILFGCVSCNNQQQLLIKLLKDKQMPILEVAYPQSRDQLIHMINRIKIFLENLEKYKGKKYLFNEDNLTVDLKPNTQRIELEEFKKIVNKK